MCEDDVVTVTGNVFERNCTDRDEIPTERKENLQLKEKDIYKELRLRGYNYRYVTRNCLSTGIVSFLSF